MQSVVEFRHFYIARSLDLFCVFVAAAADGLVREKVIGYLRALQGAGMAHVARKLLLQVDAMREGSRR